MESLVKLAKNKSFLPLVVLISVAYGLYWGTFDLTWTYDDFPVIVQNPDIRSLQAFWQDQYHGRPIRELSYLLDYHFFGLNPTGYHLQQIFWHGLCGGLLFLVIRRLGGLLPVAWISSLLFLVHPLQVEVVANLGHRKESLALAFGLMSLLSYTKSFDRLSRRVLWIGLALVFYVIAVQSKQNMVGLLLVFWAYEIARLAPSERLLAKHKWVNISGLVALLLGCFWWLFYYLGSEKFISGMAGMNVKLVTNAVTTLSAYYQTVLKAMAFLLSRIVFPHELYPEYLFSIPTSWADPWVVGALIFILLGIFGLIFSFRRDPLIFFCLVFVTVTLAPTSNMFGYFAYPAADRYLYAPLAGILTILTVLAFMLVRGKIVPFAGLGGGVVIVLIPLTFWQVPIWATPDTLAAHILKYNPRSVVALSRIGEAYSSAGEVDRALGIFLSCLEIEPQNEDFLHNVGALYLNLNRLDDAVIYLKKAIEVNPRMAMAYINLGLAMERQGDSEEAVELILQGIALNKALVSGYQVLGKIYYKQGQKAKAKAIYIEGITHNPIYPVFYHELGLIFLLENNNKSAEKNFLLSLELYPNNQTAWRKLLELYMKTNREKDAERVRKILEKF